MVRRSDGGKDGSGLALITLLLLLDCQNPAGSAQGPVLVSAAQSLWTLSFLVQVSFLQFSAIRNSSQSKYIAFILFFWIFLFKSPKRLTQTNTTKYTYTYKGNLTYLYFHFKMQCRVFFCCGGCYSVAKSCPVLCNPWTATCLDPLSSMIS